MTGIKIHHIPYRGGGPALNDVIGGQVKFFFSNGAASIGHVQGGAVRAMAHTGAGRLAALPDLPAVAETLPGFEAYEWNGVFVPIGTPAQVVEKLNAGLNATLRQEDIIARLRSLSVEVRENTPEEFRAFVAAETAKWGRVVREANIKLGNRQARCARRCLSIMLIARRAESIAPSCQAPMWLRCSPAK
jgi:tripartite-type tricarboxylate transporter receptor subunit TctC